MSDVSRTEYAVHVLVGKEWIDTSPDHPLDANWRDIRIKAHTDAGRHVRVFERTVTTLVSGWSAVTGKDADG